jgi:hypothetical protein
MQTKVVHEHSEKRSLCWDNSNCKTFRFLRMKWSRSMFYREEQAGGERRLAMKDDGKPSAPIAEHRSLKLASN